ncbi:MAG: hypothetical protein MI717_02035 [Spirochaetales bacterium]|nr:hypothetical protein [Spirochaetales bacterium]
MPTHLVPEQGGADNGGVKTQGPPPYCPRCIHYFVTWNPSFPKGCRLFGLKSRRLPSEEVRAANGRDCPSFTEKSGLK